MIICSITARCIPEFPLTNEFARTHIIALVSGIVILSPIAQACERIKLTCNAAKSSEDIDSLTRAPNPVFIPYTVSPLERIFSTTFLDASTLTQASDATSTFSPIETRCISVDESVFPSNLMLPIGITTVYRVNDVVLCIIGESDFQFAICFHRTLDGKYCAIITRPCSPGNSIVNVPV